MTGNANEKPIAETSSVNLNDAK